MALPSTRGGRTTEEVGFFQVGAEALADWMVSAFNAEDSWAPRRWPPRWTTRTADVTTLDGAVALLRPGTQRDRLLCVSVHQWTVLLTNGPLGTDVGMVPRRAARSLGCRALRVVSTAGTARYPARILEVFDPNAPSEPAERSIAAANDGGRWVFHTYGQPYAFEDQSAYARRSKSSRFTTSMVFEYLRALGVPFDAEPDWPNAVIVQLTG